MKTASPCAIRIIALTFLIPACWLTCGCQFHGPIVTRLTPHSASVVWLSGRNDPRADFRIWPDGRELNRKTIRPTYVSDPWGIYRADVDGLDAYTAYRYSITMAPGKRLNGGFQTAPDDPSQPFTFLVYGDTQNLRNHSEVSSEMSEQTDAVFVLHTGDLVNFVSLRQWNSFFKGAEPILREFAFFPTCGNHEKTSQALRDVMGFPGGRLWYSFDFGSLHAIALDSTSDYSPKSEQFRWLIDDLEASASSTWKVVFFHHPPYSPNWWNNTKDARLHLAPLFERYGVSAVFTGHSHVYDHFEVNGVHYIVSGGGGGWAITREDSPMGVPFHFMNVSVTPDALTVSCIRSDGAVIDRFVIPAHPVPRTP